MKQSLPWRVTAALCVFAAILVLVALVNNALD